MEEPLLTVDTDDDENQSSQRLHPKMRAYLWGQCFNVAKISIWWTSLSPLILATSGRDEAIGASRVAFNLAMILVSPVAGALVQHKSMAGMLRWTNLWRGVVWGISLPLLWVLLAEVFDVDDLGTWMVGDQVPSRAGVNAFLWCCLAWSNRGAFLRRWIYRGLC